MNNDRATLFTALSILALAGHKMGDYGTQTDRNACRKARPDLNVHEDVPYWETWLHNQIHCLTYHATLAATVAAGTRVLGLRVNKRRAVAALAVSWATHAVIDRRWPVKKSMEATGSGGWYEDGKALVDQMMHETVLVALAAFVASGESSCHKC